MKIISIMAICLILGACATGYSKRSIFNGFDETALAPDTYRISFHGNAFTSMGRANDMILLRAAEIAIKNNYRYFAVIDHAESVRSSYTKSPVAITNNPGLYANGVMYKSPSSTITGGNVSEIQKPAAKATIKLLNEKINDQVFDANFIFQSLTSKYKIQPKD